MGSGIADRLIAGPPSTSIFLVDIQRREANHGAKAGQGGTTGIADSSWALLSLCRDFVLDPSTVENLTGDCDSLFSTPEPDPEASLGAGASLPPEPNQATATRNEEHEEGKQYHVQPSLVP